MKASPPRRTGRRLRTPQAIQLLNWHSYLATVVRGVLQVFEHVHLAFGGGGRRNHHKRYGVSFLIWLSIGVDVAMVACSRKRKRDASSVSSNEPFAAEFWAACVCDIFRNRQFLQPLGAVIVRNPSSSTSGMALVYTAQSRMVAVHTAG